MYQATHEFTIRQTLRAIRLPRRNPSTSTAQAIERLKNPSRSSQNLTDRYKRLERSLRGKEAYTKQLLDIDADSEGSREPPSSLPRKGPRKFRGFVIPERPTEPKADECCMSGCAVCVYDLYEESLEAYNKAVGLLRASLQASHIPEGEWPLEIQTKEVEERKKSITLSTFEELERSLKAKHDREAEIKSPLVRRPAAPKRSTLASVKPSAIYEALSWVAFSKR
ncbi:hypothetical protein BD410DRAFT_786079 [Rickenella mellea]|uniref:Oxidoreductase-like domain-containing protein n=1 Tax=Rickenella mellea TaxID=50990 RepID=A0A4Y7QCJ6_9AGAM|nr:hypothetical protein BD410DRAFT_786079 [Rickenella mellea]